MTQPSEENRDLARYIIGVFGGRPGVREYFDDQKLVTIDMLTCTDAGQRGVNAYSTLALSDVEAFNSDGTKLPFGVELIAACEADATQFVNVISTCAFNIIKDQMPIYPDAVYPNAIKMYEGLSSTLSHVLIVDPFLWDRSFDTRQLKTKKVGFLQVVGIAESEYAFLRKQGADALLDLFVDKEIDVYDINRPAAV